MPTLLKDRLKQARLAKRPPMSQSDVARAAGCSPQTVQQLEDGKILSSKYLPAIAAAVDVSFSWLVDLKIPSIPDKVNVAIAPVRGIVAGGLWQEDTYTQIEDKTLVPASPKPQYSRRTQVAYRVVGDSMDEVVKDGEYVICIENKILRDGDIVVVERHRAGELERTIKEYREGAGGPELWPRSSNPDYQEPIRIDAPEDGTTVEIVGFVVGYYRDR